MSEIDSQRSFEAYLAAARGKTGLWRVLVGLLFIGGFWIVGTVLVMLVHVLVDLSRGIPLETALGALRDLAEAGSQQKLVWLLLTFSGVWAGVAVTVEVLHAHRFWAVFAPTPRVRWGDFGRGIGLALLFTIPGILLSFAFAEPARTETGLGTWLLWLVPLVPLVFVQATAEELIFRGYLLQQLGNWRRSPWVWAGIPSILFGLMHFSPQLPDHGGYYYVLVTFLTGLTLAVLVWRTGSLWAAAGLHVGVNVMGLTVIGTEGILNGAQLWMLPKAETASLFRLDLVMSLLMLALVVSPVGRRWFGSGSDPAPGGNQRISEA